MNPSPFIKVIGYTKNCKIFQSFHNFCKNLWIFPEFLQNLSYNFEEIFLKIPYNSQNFLKLFSLYIQIWIWIDNNSEVFSDSQSFSHGLGSDLDQYFKNRIQNQFYWVQGLIWVYVFEDWPLLKKMWFSYLKCQQLVFAKNIFIRTSLFLNFWWIRSYFFIISAIVLLCLCLFTSDKANFYAGKSPTAHKCD